MKYYDNKTSKIVVLSLVVIILLGVLVNSFLGGKQDEKFLKDQAVYNEAVKQLEELDYSAADKTLSLIKNSYKGSEQVNYVISIAATNSGNPQKGLIHMQRVLDINPHNVEDSIFMLQYAQILIANEKYDEAKIVLVRCQTLTPPESYPNYQELITQLIQQVESQL